MTMRRVDQFTGAKAPTSFFKALSEADNLCREVADVDLVREENASLRCRVDELTAEVAALRGRLAAFRGAGDAR